MDITLARSWVQAVATAVETQQDHLTQLDSAIGDADHGANMHRGFSAVTEALATQEPTSVGEVLTKTGTTLISKVGGASGPLYGTVFRTMGKALTGPEADVREFSTALAAGLEALRKLGAAAEGDKTMVDAYTPAAEAFARFAEGSTDGAGSTDSAGSTDGADGGDFALAARAAAEAAEEGMRATVEMQARKGRASYLGPRSVGHQDPGATSTALVFRALADASAAA